MFWSFLTNIWACTKLFMGISCWMTVELEHYYPNNFSAMWCWKTLSFRIWVLYNQSFKIRHRPQISKLWVITVPNQSHNEAPCYFAPGKGNAGGALVFLYPNMVTICTRSVYLPGKLSVWWQRVPDKPVANEAL